MWGWIGEHTSEAAHGSWVCMCRPPPFFLPAAQPQRVLAASMLVPAGCCCMAATALHTISAWRARAASTLQQLALTML